MKQPEDDEANQLLKRTLEDDGDKRNRLIDFGIRVLHRMSAKLHQMVCLENDEDLAKKFEAAFTKGKVALAAFLSSLLVSVGVPLSIAAIVASLLAMAFSDALVEELCSVWANYNKQL